MMPSLAMALSFEAIGEESLSQGPSLIAFSVVIKFNRIFTRNVPRGTFLFYLSLISDMI